MQCGQSLLRHIDRGRLRIEKPSSAGGVELGRIDEEPHTDLGWIGVVQSAFQPLPRRIALDLDIEWGCGVRSGRCD